jgi:hypothetical protein
MFVIMKVLRPTIPKMNFIVICRSRELIQIHFIGLCGRIFHENRFSHQIANKSSFAHIWWSDDGYLHFRGFYHFQ